ncbi:hypothetical protein [Sphingomonas sp.]
MKLGPSLAGGPEERTAYDDMLFKPEMAKDVSSEPRNVRGVAGWWCHPA